LSVFPTKDGESRLLAPGRYDCELRKVAGEWRFQRRVVIHPRLLARRNAAAIRAAFDRPVDAAPPRDLARGRQSACILIYDITRPVPNHLFPRPMIEMMTASGIRLDHIATLVATGLHRPNLGDEMAEVVGDPWVMANVRVLNHYARDMDDHVDLGPTATRGTPVSINRILIGGSGA
jgi:nickel-dependent lactate racemase